MRDSGGFLIDQSVTLHDALHGFRMGRGTGTATLEAKLAHQLARIIQELLFQVFLYVRKVCNSMDRGWCMYILRGYGMGQNTARLIAHHWESLLFVTKASRFLWMVFGTRRGVLQCAPASPMIFNIVVDAVGRAVLKVVCGLQEEEHGMGWAEEERNLVF